MYNHHQTGPAGTVMFSPPFRDPFNYNFDPMIVMGLDMVGAAIHQRLLEENKPGFTMRSGSSYSTWWNGGLRTIGYFQGIIGILTETIGNPTPERIPFIPAQQLPRGDIPAPVTPGVWHFRQSIDYSVTANYAILDLASRYRETFLYDKYLMAKHAIEARQPGSLDRVGQGHRGRRGRARGWCGDAGRCAGGGSGRWTRWTWWSRWRSSSSGVRRPAATTPVVRSAMRRRRSAAATRTSMRRCTRTTTCCTRRTSAIRAATSSRPTSRTS